MTIIGFIFVNGDYNASETINYNFYNTSDEDKKNTENTSKTKEDIEEVDFEFVNNETKTQSDAKRTNDQNYECQHSEFLNLMTFPNEAEYLNDWLHKNINKDNSDHENILHFYAVNNIGLFKSKVSYKIFVKEFGDIISQSNYSKLMRRDNNFSDDELTLALQTLDLSRFNIKNKP